jgi:hypothetical protein
MDRQGRLTEEQTNEDSVQSETTICMEEQLEVWRLTMSTTAGENKYHIGN